MPRKTWFQHHNVRYSECGCNKDESFGASPAPLFLYVHFREQARLADALSINCSNMGIAPFAVKITA